VSRLAGNLTSPTTPGFFETSHISFYEKLYPIKLGGLGLIDLLKWNKAAFTTHLNNINSGANSIWAVWCHKHYFGTSYIWTVQKRQNASWIWKGILEACDRMLPLYHLSISNTSEASFWRAPWSGNGVILDCILSHNNRIMTRIPWTVKASSYICNGKVSLPHSNSQRVINIWRSLKQLRFPERRADELLWGFQSSASFRQDGL